MKPLLEIATGFVASLGMFALGLAAATLLLTAEPGSRPGPSADVANLWTDEPRRVDPAAQAFERVAAVQRSVDPRLTEAPAVGAPAVEAQDAEAQHADAGSDAVDGITTASLAGDETEDESLAGEEPGQELAEQLAIAHVEWCANRYRSYRPAQDSYTSYDGRRRPCVSPYSRELAASGALADAPDRAVLADDAEIQNAGLAAGDDAGFAADDPSDLAWLDGSDPGVAVDSDHVAYCFSRYRSYRPEDNSYQPYDGGPRRQCR
jgi:hypothetical protein